jgi:hypothetical protein
MSESNYLIVKPDLRFKSAPDSDITFVTELNQTQSEVVDYDRTVNIIDHLEIIYIMLTLSNRLLMVFGVDYQHMKNLNLLEQMLIQHN